MWFLPFTRAFVLDFRNLCDQTGRTTRNPQPERPDPNDRGRDRAGLLPEEWPLPGRAGHRCPTRARPPPPKLHGPGMLVQCTCPSRGIPNSTASTRGSSRFGGGFGTPRWWVRANLPHWYVRAAWLRRPRRALRGRRCFRSLRLRRRGGAPLQLQLQPCTELLLSPQPLNPKSARFHVDHVDALRELPSQASQYMELHKPQQDKTNASLQTQ